MTIKELFTIVLAAMLLTGASACNSDEMLSPPETQTPDGPEKPNAENMKIRIKAGNAVFTATLRDNAAARAFQAMLPLTLDMDELNRNEKYADLPARLPAESENPGTIRNGDIMFYGSRTLVLFYKTFRTSYDYTRIGTLDNPAGLERALGSGRVAVVFESAEPACKICNEFRFGLESTLDLQKKRL